MKKLLTLSLAALFFGVVQAQTESLTFRVDMNQQTVSPNGVHVAGNWQDEAGFGGEWQPGASEMLDGDADGVYELTVEVPVGNYEFKYINGNDWTGANNFPEGVPGACAQNSNRFVDVVSGGVTLDAVCFGSCNPCPAVGSDVNVTFQVDGSQLSSIDPAGIHIAGTFNGFSPVPMTDEGGGIYSFTIQAASGSNVLYKFTNSPDFSNVELVPDECGEDDGFGGNNRTLDVPESDITLPAVCFSSCSECTDPGVSYDLTVQVDASELTEVNAAGIHVAGNFNGFSPQPMTDQGNGIWTATVSVEEGTTALWKYINGPTFGDEVESVPSECGQDDGFGGFNRDFLMPSEDTTLDVVCFGQCVACDAAPENYMLTLIVDASQLAEIAVEGIHVAGSFNGFTPEAMTDEGGGQYSYTAVVAEGSTVLWKYINGTTFDDEVESVPEDCGQDDGFGGFNRVLVMPSNDVTNGPVCFSSCEACPTEVPCETPYPSPDGLSFNNVNGGVLLTWNPILGSIACQVQVGSTAANSVKIITTGDNPSDFFINGNQLVNGTTYSWRVRCGCSLNPVIAGPFSEISQFTYLNFGLIAAEQPETILRAVPNPSNGQTFVSLNTSETIDQATIEVFDMGGRLVEVLYSGNVPAQNEMRIAFDGSDLPEGIYLIRFTTKNEVTTEKFMISR